MPKVAITGNIAAGKSVVEDILRAKGYQVYDTDKMTHELLDSSEEVYSAFKDYDVFEEGKISRKKLGKLVFSDESLLLRLESIIHPKIQESIISMPDRVFISVPLLFEAEMDSLFDKIIFISADENLRLKRLIARNSFTEQEAMIRIKSQDSEEEKIQKSDYIIVNNGTVEEVAEQIDIILEELL